MINLVHWFGSLPDLAKAAICLAGVLLLIVPPLLKHTIPEQDGSRKWNF